MAPTEPFYVALHRRGELASRAAAARERLAHCTLCGHRCGVDRLSGDATGACATGAQARVYSYGPHFGEERPLSGGSGSGTIFFESCNLACVFCQNWEISQRTGGRELASAELAEIMLELQRQGCHNINLVSPSHVVAPFLAALPPAVERGLRLPIVYNTGGYDSDEALALLDGVVDIYMPDVKCADDATGQILTGAPDYASVNRRAVSEMHRQVGDLELDERGVARRGLLVRHLVLPDALAGTPAVAAFLAGLSRDTFVNLMAQYRPCYRAHQRPPLDRRPSSAELVQARRDAERQGLWRFDS
jgi:putative pyruvate formate lyase activating enzyme